MNPLLVGVSGVLTGRSMGIVKLREDGERDMGCSAPCEPFFCLGVGLVVELDLLLLIGGLVGTEGKTGSLFNSSRGGKARLNPLISSLLRYPPFCNDGSEGGGEGGPRVDGDTNVRVELEVTEEEEEVEGFIEGGDGNEFVG